MAKLIIATVIYRAYLRVEDDNADKATMLEMINCEEKDISGNQEPIGIHAWEWNGDKLDPSFLDTKVFGDNPGDEFTVRQVAEEHRGYAWQVDKDNPTPIKNKAE